jgi:hypothetical protein
MDQNTVIFSLAGTVTAIVGVLGLLVKAWVDSRRDTNWRKQCLECGRDHQKIIGLLEGAVTRQQAIQKTLDNREPVFSKISEWLIQIKADLEAHKD